MIVDAQIAEVARLIGDPTRSAILMALMAGKALTAGELAIRANISAQTASNHLKKLLDANLIILIKTPTRYRYYKIVSPLVAAALESLSLLSMPEKKRPPRHEKLDPQICFARTCYDHLAGELGVKIVNRLQQKNYLQLTENKFIILPAGELFFNTCQIHSLELVKLKRPVATPCLDWTEREYHLSGSLGSALLNYFVTHKLLINATNKARIMLLTRKGRQWLEQYLDII